MKALTPILLLVASLGMFFYFIRPHYETVKQHRASIVENDDAIERAQKIATLRDNLLERKASFSPADIDRLNELLPDSVDNITLVIDIDSIANRYGTSIRDIRVSSPQVATAQKTVGPDEKPYATTMIGFGISLTYEQFVDFLSDIEHSLRLTDINSITFTPKDEGTTYDFNINLSTYWLKP
jgi:Tfp pilus assembly protein PilO